MQLTPNFRLRKPDGTDPVDVQDFNDNADVIDTNLAGKLDKTGDASNAVTKFTQAGSRANLTSGEKLSLSLGKAMKWFADLKTVAFSGSYSDLSGKPSIPSGTAASCGVANNDTTTASGFVADARIVKTHGDEIDTLNQNLAGLPTVKAGITELTFSGGNTTLTHNAGFPDTNYAAMFLCDNVRMFPRMSTNIDGNKTTLSASAVNGAGAIANLDGKYRVMWIVARST
ncbi:hypothetical protein [Eisenbergiella massiliensis]|uniref:hypothetical protein n=1 Tax=Eisenbergiella massiliensis TaxID=1720294 RepID=UPI003992573F